MNAMIPVIYIQFLILMGPAIVMTASIIKNIKRENFHDRRALAEMKLARLHGLAFPEDTRAAA